MPRTTTPAKAESPSWADALDRFDAHLVELERSDHTRANYHEDLEAFAEWYEAKYQDPPTLALLAPSELREWKAHLREERGQEPATVNRKLSALGSLLRWAEAEGLAPEVRRPKAIRRVVPPPKWLDKRQQRAVLRAAERTRGARDHLIITVLLHTGLRVEELVDVRWDDLVLKERSGSLKVVGKGRKQRTIPLNADARAAFLELKACGPRRGPEVFQGERGPLKVRAVQVILKKVAHAAKVPELSPHVLRHTFGKNLADSGAGIQLIADLMGHESLETTRRYIQPGHDDLAAAVEKLAGGDG
jgi:integrase/recombinase XerC